MSNIEFFGNEKLLPKNSLSRLRTKVKNIGTEEDKIFIKAGVDVDTHTREVLTDGFFGLLALGKEVTHTNWRTNVQMLYCFPSKSSVGPLEMSDIPYIKKVTQNVPDKLGAYKTIYKYINNIKSKFE